MYIYLYDYFDYDSFLNNVNNNNDERKKKS